MQEEFQSKSKPISIANANKLKVSTSLGGSPPEEFHKSTMGARATDSARIMKFTKVLSGTVVILGILTFYISMSFIDFFLVTPTLLHLFLELLAVCSYEHTQNVVAFSLKIILAVRFKNKLQQELNHAHDIVYNLNFIFSFFLSH